MYSWYTGLGTDCKLLDPIDARYIAMRHLEDNYRHALQNLEQVFRTEPTEKAFSEICTIFFPTFATHLTTGFLKQTLDALTPEAMAHHIEVKQRAIEDAGILWTRQYRREKIFAIARDDPYFFKYMDLYDLSEQELATYYSLTSENWAYYFIWNEPGFQLKKLYFYRALHRFNMADFARLIDYPVDAYPNFEYGVIDDPRLEMGTLMLNPQDWRWFQHLLDATGISPGWLQEDPFYHPNTRFFVEEEPQPEPWRFPGDDLSSYFDTEEAAASKPVDPDEGRFENEDYEDWCRYYDLSEYDPGNPADDIDYESEEEYKSISDFVTTESLLPVCASRDTIAQWEASFAKLKESISWA